MRKFGGWGWSLGTLLLVACGSDDGPSQGESGSEGSETSSPDDSAGETGSDEQPLDPGDLSWPELRCDPLVPSYCAFPFPSNVYTVPDAETATGLRVKLSSGVFVEDDPAFWAELDGFSPGSAIMAELPGASGEGLPSHTDIDASLAEDAKTVLLEAETGERVPHYSELDLTTDDATRRTLLIRPAVRLKGGTRYIVAIRGVTDAAGAAVPASPAFAALRDRTDLPDEPSIEARRALYGDIFARLRTAGIDREDLQLAWDFTTASDESLTGWLLHMRDETFDALGPDGSPPFTIDSVDTQWYPEEFLFKIEGTFEAPLYLDSTDPSTGRLVFGPDGLPEPSGTVDVPFVFYVPRTAEETPAGLIQHGHGLLGARDQTEGDNFRELSIANNYAFFGVDWIGMSSEDNVFIGLALANGRSAGMATMMDRLHQGALHQLLAMRVAWAGLANDPMIEGLIDPDRRHWYGISQGGILGGVYMATTLDVERGILDVMGQPYNLLLTRSVDFDIFFQLVRARWADPRDVMYVLGAVQMLWDRVEPNGYTKFIRDPLPGTPPHEVMLTAAIGDHQVTTLGGHVFARSIEGLRHLDTGIRPVWGLDTVTGEHTGSAYVEYDFGLPPDPICNVPQTACEDPHGKLRNVAAAREQIAEFLATGTIRNFCPDGVCSYPDLSGCPGEEPPADVCEN